MNKLVYPVEPYNQFALRDCYFSMVFPIVKHFGGSVDTLAVATNNDISFVFENGRLRQIDSRKSRENLNEYLVEQGISMRHDESYHENIIEFVCDSLDKEDLVVVSLSDAISYDPKTGNKTGSHGGYSHWILFYGYDKENTVFNVIDHFSVESPIYCKLLMNFDEIKRSYDEHEKNFGSKLQLFSNIHETLSTDEIKAKYLMEWKRSRNENSIADYLSFLEDFFKSDFQKFRRYRFFVAEDIVHLSVYYLQQKFVLTVLGADKAIIKLIDRQNASILAIKQKLFDLREVKTNEDFAKYISGFEFSEQFIENGKEIEGFINGITAKKEE